MASKNSSAKNEDDDEVWMHRPSLKRVRKSEDQFSSSQQNGTSSSQSTPRPRDMSGIPQSQCGVTPSSRPTNHLSRRKIFDSSQKPSKSGCASQPSRTPANKSGKKQHKMKKDMTNTENNHDNKCETGDKLQGYCPICQAPFCSIHLRSPEQHIQDCLELPKPVNECPEGESCNITILSHYEKFSHDLLALVRSQMTPDESSMMDDRFTSLKAEPEVMTSDSDFEIPSSSKPAAAAPSMHHGTPQGDYEYKIKGERVILTPRTQCSSQIAPSQPKSKLKNTARKSAKGVINRNQRTLDRILTVKEEMTTPKRETLRESETSYTDNQKSDDAASEGSDLLFSSQNSNFEEDSDATSRNRPKKSNPPNFIEVPPAPIQDDDDDDDDTTLEDFFFADANGDATSDAGGQGSKRDGEVKGQETLEDESQKEGTENLINTSVSSLDDCEGKMDLAVVFSEDEDSQSLFNIPGENKEGQFLTVGNLNKNKESVPTLDDHEGKMHQAVVFSEDEPSQSLFNIPGVGNLPSKPDDAAERSEDEDEDMEVDDEDEEELQNKEERPSVSGWGTSDARSAMSAKDEEYSRQSNVQDTSTSTPAVTPKLKKQGTLDSFLGCKPSPKIGPSSKQGTLDFFLGCKPAPKVEPPSQKIQEKGQWRGGKQTNKRNKGEGDGKKEWGNSSGKECPFYKKMPDTSFTVDAFRYGVIPGCKAYFLSHFHYDHYVGLTKHFDQQLYCSKVTGNLVISRMNVAAEYVKILPMNEPCIVDGVEVTLLEANHCPGAVMFLYKLKSGVVYLHTGDFRANVEMELYPELSSCHVNQLYLDTTYCDPQYKFPSQTEVIEFAVQTAVQAVRSNKRTLIVCATYTIGKEKVFRAIAEALECKVYVDSQKFKVLECLEDDDLMSLLTRDNKESTCRLHVIPMNMLTGNHQKLKEYLSQFSSRFDNILAFKPTGWTHSDKVESPSDIKPSKSGKSTIYGIPYSEHSSYSEMKRFVQFIRADKILATVNNGNPQKRKAMDDIFKRWMAEDGRSSSPTRLKSVKIMKWFT